MKRMNFEKALSQSGLGEIMSKLYSGFAHQGIGREVVLFATVIK